MHLINVLIIFNLVFVSIAHSSECYKTFGSKKNTDKKTNAMDDLLHHNASLPPSTSLMYALKYSEIKKIKINTAIDLGAGSGNDSIALLKNGARVQSVDINQSSIEYLNAIKAIYPSQLEVFQSSIEKVKLIKSDLINAQNVLSFLTPDQFKQAWINIKTSLRIGGLFTGTFFDKTWSSSKNNATFNREQVESLLSNFNILVIKEGEQKRLSPGGEPIYFKIYVVIAEKKSN